MESNNVQLHPVTWLALVALGFVGYLYVRQKSLEKKLTQGQPSYANQTRGPQATPYFGATSRQPNFPEKEIEPRKLAKELDTDTFKQRSPKYQPSFEQFGLSGDRNKRQGFEGLEKAFDDSRRMTSYKPLQKPIESYSVFSDLGKPEQPAPTVSSNVPVHSTPSHLINKGISLHSGGLSGKIEPEIQNRLAQAPSEGTQEIISTKEKLNIHRADDNDNEYKVFREFKQKGTRILHEEPRRFESPQRQAWGISPLDHSPDSPFRIFESSLAGSIKRDEDLVKHPKQRAGSSLIANKKDPFLKAQDALNERVNPIGSKLSKFAAKAESKNRSNQIFMDVDSDEDSMIVETQRGHGNINKRSGAESQSVDALERDTLKSKYFKDNNLKASFKGPEGKRIILGQNLQPIGISQKAGAKDSKDQSKKKSSTDIAYLTEYGSNLTMKRYMERKALTDSAAKASRLSSSMIAPPKTSGSMIAEEPVSRSLLINRPAAAEKPKPAVQTQSFTSSLKSDGIMIGGSKTTDIAAKKPAPTVMESEATQTQEAPIKKDNKPDFGIKTAEPVKISSILGGSSIFSQPKPAAESTTTTNGNGAGSLFGGKKQETEEPKKTTEVEPPAAKEETTPKESSPIETTPTTTTTQALPKGFNMGGDLFKTQKFGATIPTKPEENKEKTGGLFSNTAAPKKEEEPEKSTSSPPKEQQQQPKAPLFGFLAGKSAETTTETEKAPAQQNGEKKNIFGGLVQPAATFGGSLELKKEDSKKSDTGSTSLFGSSKPSFGSGSLFGGKKDENTEKPADEQPKTSFFNKTEQKQEAPAASGGFFGNLTKKTSSPDSSPKNEQKPASGLGLFSNTSNSFLKSGTAAKEDDAQNKSSAPMFGSLKPVGSSSENKPSGSLFGNTTSTLGGGPSLFSNAAAGSGSVPASGSLFGSGAATSLKTPSTGLFANLTSNSNKEGGSGGLFANLNK